MKKHYVYLVENKERTRFKIGQTSQKNPNNRLRNYTSHSPDIKAIGIWEVPDKKLEKYIAGTLKLKYRPLNTPGQKEWLIGKTTKEEVDAIVESEIKKYKDHQERMRQLNI